jgi:hypothetical protein
MEGCFYFYFLILCVSCSFLTTVVAKKNLPLQTSPGADLPQTFDVLDRT